MNTSPTVLDGTIYLQNAEQTVFALDSQTGSEEWVTEIEAREPSASVASFYRFINTQSATPEPLIDLFTARIGLPHRRHVAQGRHQQW